MKVFLSPEFPKLFIKYAREILEKTFGSDSDMDVANPFEEILHSGDEKEYSVIPDDEVLGEKEGGQ